MRSNRTFLWSATALGLFILFSFFVAISYDSYRNDVKRNEQAAANDATLAEQEVARNIELFDLSIQAVVAGVNDPEVMREKPRLRQMTLFDRAATADGLGALVAMDSNGTIFLDSLSTPPRHGNFGDREYFIKQRDSRADLGLYISKPFRARLQHGIWSISLSRRLTKPDGSFGGIVSGTLRLTYFQELFDKVALGLGGTIALFKDDGTLLARNGATDRQIGTNWANSNVFARYLAEPTGSFISDQTPDGIERLYAFRRVGHWPLLVVVALPIRQVLAPWLAKVLVYLAIFAIMAGSVVFLVWMLEAELRRQAAAKTAAEALARIDGLTQLANRRAFDEVLSREWARNARHGRPLSLIMIDVDQFKRFNDTYGHQSGDDALAAIAAVIAEVLKRPTDFAARYGGEEFAVLLPETDRDGATQIANAIRDGVRRLRIAHAGSSNEIVTISAGVATKVARSGLAMASLVHDADAALYRAKAQGRDATCGDGAFKTPEFEPPHSRASLRR